MQPEFPTFKPVEPGDMELIGKFTDNTPSAICEFSFANLIIWRDFDRPTFTLMEENLLIRIEPPDEAPFFLEPLGVQPLGVGDMGRITRMCMRHTGRISRASDHFASRMSSDIFDLKPIRDHFDYLYSVRSLAELKGRKFDGKRGHIRRMKKTHPDYQYIGLTMEMGREALAFFEDWCNARQSADGVRVTGLNYNHQRTAISRAFEHYNALRLMGGALVADGKIIGLVIGSRLKGDIACVHFCYARPDVPGSFQTLLWEACCNTFSGFKYVNLEQDLGLSGLRRLKTSYYPTKMEKKFEVKL